ncbi:MAG: hypothetical protein CVV51_09435, partial [Spirochaetae bacterium HGW-Spirochaetae-7]
MTTAKKVSDSLLRAQNALRLRDFETAERYSRKSLLEEPTSKAARMILGTVYLRTNRPTDALAAFLSAIESDSKDVRALEGMAIAYLRLSKPKDALSALERAVVIKPNDAELLFNLGNAHKALGNLRSAEMSFTGALELDPKHVIAFNNLGNVYMALGDNAKAVQVFWRGLAVDPNYPSFHFNLGIAYEALGKPAEAITEFEAAVKGRPGWIEAMSRYGECLGRNGEHKRSIDVYSQIIAIDPLNAPARNGIGLAYAEAGKPDEAVSWFRKALEADPKFLDAAVNIQGVLEKTGRYAEAIGEIQALVDLMPDNDGLRVQLARLYRALGHLDLSLDTITDVLRRSPNDIEALKIYGALLQSQGKPDKAREAYRKIV